MPMVIGPGGRPASSNPERSGSSIECDSAGTATVQCINPLPLTMSYTERSMGGPTEGKVVPRCMPSQLELTAGVTNVGTPMKPSTGTAWLVVVVSIRPMTDMGAVYVGPVTARAVERYAAPKRSPSSDGTPRNLSSP